MDLVVTAADLEGAEAVVVVVVDLATVVAEVEAVEHLEVAVGELVQVALPVLRVRRLLSTRSSILVIFAYRTRD